MQLQFFSAAFLAVTSFYISTPAAAQDQPCVGETIITTAEVTTSYGAAYRVETYYRSPSEIAARFITETPALMVTEGPFVWTQTNDGAALGGEDERRFILGHQFHALAFDFDTIMTDVTERDDIPFQGELHAGRKGVYPQGGAAAVILGDDDKPVGLILSLPEETPIKVAYSDWRETASGRAAPYAATIMHKGNTYSYRYDEISFSSGGREAFQNRYPAPPLEQVAEFRAGADKCPAANNE